MLSNNLTDFIYFSHFLEKGIDVGRYYPSRFTMRIIYLLSHFITICILAPAIIAFVYIVLNKFDLSGFIYFLKFFVCFTLPGSIVLSILTLIGTMVIIDIINLKKAIFIGLSVGLIVGVIIHYILGVDPIHMIIASLFAGGIIGMLDFMILDKLLSD